MFRNRLHPVAGGEDDGDAALTQRPGEGEDLHPAQVHVEQRALHPVAALQRMEGISAAGTHASGCTSAKALRGIEAQSASSGDWTMAIPPAARMRARPTAPSLPRPESTIPAARGPKARAADSKSTSARRPMPDSLQERRTLRVPPPGPPAASSR